ncbi:MAG: quinolinate synthase NadA [Spirochaetes bacterium]|nr:quinolinate synthase NadA [Spirochaetota bacterium]
MSAGAADLAARLAELKRAKHATVLAHVYTVPEVQDAADFVGDSLGLSREAAGLDPSIRIIVFCGVHFMAETAAMLSPGRTVLLPDATAGCPMADMVSDEDVRAMRREHPGAAVACYVNSTAAVKAESDVCVTSSNAVRVISRLAEREVIFVPDRSLGLWVQKQVPDKRLILWDGFCPIHHAMLRAQVEAARRAHPGALVLAHPENTEELLGLADYIGSTEQIVRHARESKATEFIIATENGILHRLRAQNPGKAFHAVSEGAVCPDMKKSTLESVVACLEGELNPVTVDPAVAGRALRAINRMLELS